MDDPPADGVEGIVHVCNLPSGVRQLLKSLHRVDVTQIFKAAVALVNVCMTKEPIALFE